MKCSLECPHPMFEKHHKEFLLNHCWSIMEGEKIGKWVSIVFGFGQDAILIKAATVRMASAIRRSASLIIWSPFANSPFAKLTEWHRLHVLIILSRSFCQSSCVSRATSAAFTTSNRPVGFPSGSSTPRPEEWLHGRQPIVYHQALEAVRQGIPRPFGQHDFPPCIWQV